MSENIKTESLSSSSNMNSHPSTPPNKAKPKNGLIDIFVTILIPVMILNKGHQWGLSPLQAVILALSFPFVSGLVTFIKERQMNYIALLGLINIGLSGILTLLALDGIWFAIKEAIFPLLIGIFVFGSSFTKNPFFHTMILNPATFNVDKIKSQLALHNSESQFTAFIIKATRWLSASFLLSAALNFALALFIFKPLDPSLAEDVRQQMLNEQLSRMTLYSQFVILVPSIIFLGAILYWSFSTIKKLTNLSLEEIMHQ